MDFMENNKKFMLRAIQLSIESIQNNGGPFGCVIVKQNKIISEGYRTIDIAGDQDHKLSTSQMGDLVAGIISSGPK